MKIAAMAVAGLTVCALVTACPAGADVTAQPLSGPGYRLEPPAAPDPEAEVAELQRQVTDLHDHWDNLTPAQRQQRLAQLQQQATTVSNAVQNLPPRNGPGWNCGAANHACAVRSGAKGAGAQSAALFPRVPARPLKSVRVEFGVGGFAPAEVGGRRHDGPLDLTQRVHRGEESPGIGPR